MTPMDKVHRRVVAVIRHDLLACPTLHKAMASIGSPSPEKGNMQAGMESWTKIKSQQHIEVLAVFSRHRRGLQHPTIPTR